MFARTDGCDDRCSWCDTPCAVEPAYRRQWTAMTPLENLTWVRHF